MYNLFESCGKPCSEPAFIVGVRRIALGIKRLGSIEIAGFEPEENGIGNGKVVTKASASNAKLVCGSNGAFQHKVWVVIVFYPGGEGIAGNEGITGTDGGIPPGTRL